MFSVRSIFFTKILSSMEKLTKNQDRNDQIRRVTRSSAKNIEIKGGLAKFQFQAKAKFRKNTNTSDDLPKTRADGGEGESSENEIKPNKLLPSTRKRRDHVKLEYELDSSEIKTELKDNDGCEIPLKIKKESEDSGEENALSENNGIDTKLIKSETDQKFRKMPLNWEVVLNNLREMRKNFDAPVDSMGCSKCHDEEAPPKVSV